MTTPNYGWPTPADTDFVKDGAAAIRALGDAIDETVSQAGTIPVGGIIMWSGTLGGIPDGWALCDGTNGTPNLAGKFVLGATDIGDVGSTGGEAAVRLYEQHLPGHTHPLGLNGSARSNGAHTHLTRGQVGSASMAHGDQTMLAGGAGGGGTFSIETLGGTGDHTHILNGRTEATGGNSAHNNMPPYYVLAYIMRTA